MSKRADKQQRRARRKQKRAANNDDWATYKVGDATVGGPAFNPMTGKFELDGFWNDPNAVQIIGDPNNMSGEPRMREATLDDCVDDCPICMQMREQILAGNPPQVMAYD